jgi:tRNA G10  N-methylase Trm11
MEVLDLAIKHAEISEKELRFLASVSQLEYTLTEFSESEFVLCIKKDDDAFLLFTKGSKRSRKFKTIDTAFYLIKSVSPNVKYISIKLNN